MNEFNSPTPNWGPTAWAFCHCYSLRVNRGDLTNTLPIVKHCMQYFIESIPCPVCRDHGRSYLKEKLNNIKTGKELAELLWEFHNNVNTRLGKPKLPIQILSKHDLPLVPVLAVYEKFCKAAAKKGDKSRIADNLNKLKACVALTAPLQY